MKRAALATTALLLAACTTPLERGERLYREGDRLAALEVWREVPEDGSDYEPAQERIQVVQKEFDRLVVQYKQRGHYYQAKGRLAESILNYRLALKLQPGDRETLAHVQQLARSMAARKRELHAEYLSAFAARDLPEARRRLAALQTLDPFDPELETDARELSAALRGEIDRRMAHGRRGFASGSYDASVSSFEAVLELDPDNESARGYLSYIAALRRNAEEQTGAATFEASAPFATDQEIRAEGFYQNALSAERRGNVYAAIRNDVRALEADPEHAGARRHLTRLRERNAARVPALIEEGRTAFRAEDLQSALDHWRRALLIDPGNERVSAYIARAEQQLQNLERLRSVPDVSAGGS